MFMNKILNNAMIMCATILCLQCFLTNKKNKNFAWWFFHSFFKNLTRPKDLIKMISMHRGKLLMQSVFYSNSIFGRQQQRQQNWIHKISFLLNRFSSYFTRRRVVWDYEIILSAPYSEFNDYYSIYFTLLFQFFAAAATSKSEMPYGWKKSCGFSLMVLH